MVGGIGWVVGCVAEWLDGWVVEWVGRGIKIVDHLSQAEAETGTVLDNIYYPKYLNLIILHNACSNTSYRICYCLIACNHLLDKTKV